MLTSEMTDEQIAAAYRAGNVTLIEALAVGLAADVLDDDGKPTGKTVAEALAQVMIDRAMAGDFEFFRELLDRVEGPVTTRTADASSRRDSILHPGRLHAV